MRVRVPQRSRVIVFAQSPQLPATPVAGLPRSVLTSLAKSVQLK